MTVPTDVRESPEFASLCSFISLFGEDLNVQFTQSQLATSLKCSDLESTPQQWLDMHRKLLNRIKTKCSKNKWESCLKQFVNSTLGSETIQSDIYDKDYFSITAQQRAKILNIIFDCQFDKNIKFKEKVNLKLNQNLRVLPFGSDIYGCLYWLFIDSDVNIIMYKENLEQESFKIIAESLEGMRLLLTELETLDCDNADLSKLYIESVTPEDTNSPNNDTDVVKIEETCDSENRDICRVEDTEISFPVKNENSEEITMSDVSGNISPTKAVVIDRNAIMPSKEDNNSENSGHLIIAPVESKEKVHEIESQDEETGDNAEIDSNLKVMEKKKRGRKPKVETTTPIEIEIPDLNNSLRRSERKRKPVNPFNIIFTPLSSKKHKVAECQNENVDQKSPECKKVKLKDKDYKKRGRPKKFKKHSPDKELKLEKKLKKRLKDKIKHKQKLKQPWELGESSEEHIDELDEEDLYNHEESDISPNIKEEAIWNDKPESDFDPDNLSISSDDEMLIARGRNYSRQKKRLRKIEQEEILDDKPCQICLGVTLPEMILLCDSCDMGHHAMCLKPSLMLIPEGEWFCPKCQHKKFINNLSNKIVELEKSSAKVIAKIRMQERLNFVNISMTNILSSNRNMKREHKSSNESNSHNDSPSPSYTSSSESNQSDDSSSRSSEGPHGRYKFRESSRKENTRYNFEEIDKIFDNALENDEKYQMMKKRQKKTEDDSEESAPEYDYSGIEPRKKSSGKDMSNILEEEKPQLRRPSKKKRSKFGTDDDEFEDDVKDQDFKLPSEQSYSDVDDDDDKISQNDESDSDDQNWRSRTRRSTKKGNKKKEKRKPRVEFQDAVSRPRRSVARKINYLEMLGEEEDKDDENKSSDYGSNYDTSKPPPVLSRKKFKSLPRRRKISDSEYEESKENSIYDSNNDSGSTEKLQSIKNKFKKKPRVDSDTDSEREDNKLIIEERNEEDAINENGEEVVSKENTKDKEENVDSEDKDSIIVEGNRASELCLMNPMRAKDDQDVDVENEVESETECDSESVIKVDCRLSKGPDVEDFP